MERIEFECILLSDIVIKADTATEGATKSLDYIPGSNFLGIAAAGLYDMYKQKETLDIFHNGTVCFGDAHPVFDGERTLKVPLAWFYEKGKDIVSGKVYLHHLVNDDKMIELASQGVQLKQSRRGYFAPVNKTWVKTDTKFSIKSAYDSEKRRAEDSQMYGYFSLPKGTVWSFYVDTPEEYVEKIITVLQGKKRVGRSRSAEYGLVNIKQLQRKTIASDKVIPRGKVVIYAESNLCFYDNYGLNTLQPSPLQLRLPEGSEILWEKSQIRTRLYQTWNGKRYNRDADRMVIEKGSVIITETPLDINNNIYDNGIGAHTNEGFGKVLIDPDFLQSTDEFLSFNLKKEEISLSESSYSVKYDEQDSVLFGYLRKKKEQIKSVQNVDKLVNDFIKKHRSNYTGYPAISASQWGQVRNYAKYADNEQVLYNLLFMKEIGYFMHGQSESYWRKNNRRLILKKELNNVPVGLKIEFVQKLAAEMGKYAKS